MDLMVLVQPHAMENKVVQEHAVTLLLLVVDLAVKDLLEKKQIVVQHAVHVCSKCVYV